MLTEEVSIYDTDSPLWNAVRPLLDAALRLEQGDESYVWHGWSKQQVHAFLKNVPSHCTLLAGVWETSISEDAQEQEVLVLGCLCEVLDGEICSVRTFEALEEAGLPPVKELEPGFEHALEIMRAAKKQVAPVAWALFTDKATWNEWLFADNGDGTVIDKGELLTLLAHQGRCVLLGNQTMHQHP
ncbi:MAG TPA: hypothetical protein VKR06_41655 [Ktedonosporobacter sp.]|nr:hypothetical protein [Ktedonosporobacter sp.]